MVKNSAKINFLIFFFLPFLIIPKLESQNIVESQLVSIGKEYKSDYILGPGDVLQLDFKGIDVFSGNYSISATGYLNLPEVGEIYANEKTLVQLKADLEKNFSNFLYNPLINLSIYKYRPLKITLRGEVNKTGLFNLNYFQENLPTNTSQINNFSNRQGTVIVPRLFDLIRLGEGITSYADLRNIEIVRKNPEINGGGKIKTTINLLSLLQDGDQSINLELRDGDDIFIPKSKNLLIDQLIEVNKSNLTPDIVTIFVNGNVPTPGELKVPQGLSLFEGIAAAGGGQNMTGNIEFLRFTRDGKTLKRVLRFNKNAIKGTKNNPILVNGDIIVVRRNLFGKASSVITDYSSPLINAYGIYKLFE